MADVTGTTNRGQLILVSGLTLAVTLLILVLLLNTAIYTENVATRGLDSEVGDAANFQQTVDAELAAIIDQYQSENECDFIDNVTADISVIQDQQAQRALERGHIANISDIEYETTWHEDHCVITAIEYELTYTSPEVQFETQRTVTGEHHD